MEPFTARALAAAPPPAPAAGPSLAPGTAPAMSALRRVNSDELLGGARELEIAHGDALYRLRLTALGKLILTK